MIYHYRQVPIFYEILGEGPPLILLHGFLESSTIWQQIALELSHSRKIVLVDLPGHGKSGCLAGVHGMELMAEVVDGLISELGIHSYSVVGHSMGGYVALALAQAFSEKIRTLVLLNSTTRSDSPDVIQRRNRSLPIIQNNKELLVKTVIPNLFSSTTRGLYEKEITELQKEAMSFPSEGIVAATIGMRERKDRTEVLKMHPNKKLFIAAIEDPIITFNSSKRIVEETETQLIELPGGHMSWLEQKDEIVKILHFIE